MQPVSRNRAAAGFTLLELLIAMSLVSLILVLLFGGLRLGSRSWESLNRHVDSAEDLRLARNLIQRMLLESRSVSQMVDKQMRPLFFGSKDQLEMVTPLSEYVGTGGLYLVRIYLDGEGDSKVLKMERWLLHPEVMEGDGDIPQWQVLARPPSAAGERDDAAGIYGVTKLAEDVGELTFGYFGIALGKESEPPEWSDEWDSPAYIPLLVRIHLVREEGDWPDLTVRLEDG